LNKVCDLGFGFASRSLGGAYKSHLPVWFLRVYRATGFKWRSGVVLHDSWCLGGVKLKLCTFGVAK